MPSPTRRTKPAAIRSALIAAWHSAIVVHPIGSPDAYLEGAATRHAQIARDAGPRAVLNALGRLADATSPDRHHPAGPGDRRRPAPRPPGPAGQALRPRRLPGRADGLRDRLKAGLCRSATPEPGTTPVAELAERIKALKAAHTIDAAPERTTGAADLAGRGAGDRPHPPPQ